MRRAWRREGILDRSVIVSGKTPGLYAVRTDGQGERTFAYWRQGSAAAALLAGTDWVDSLEGDLIHLSGITLQLMTPRSLEVLVNRLHLLKAQGSRVSLDTNYRPSGWPTAQAAATAITRIAGLAHVPVATVSRVVDTTAAGDSFGGAYLAGRASGATPIAAARTAAHVAAVVIANPGAIMPNDSIRTAVLGSH